MFFQNFEENKEYYSEIYQHEYPSSNVLIFNMLHLLCCIIYYFTSVGIALFIMPYLETLEEVIIVFPL